MTLRYRLTCLLICTLITPLCTAQEAPAGASELNQRLSESQAGITEATLQARKAGLEEKTITALLNGATERGIPATEFEKIMRPVVEAGQAGLPVQPFGDKILEGFAKAVDPALISKVLEQKLSVYKGAKQLIVESTAQLKPATHSISAVAFAIERGVSQQGLKQLYSRGDYTTQAIDHAAETTADLVSMGFTEAQGVAIAKSGLNAGYLDTDDATLTLIAARGKKSGLSTQTITATLTGGLQRGKTLAEISVDLKGSGGRGGNNAPHRGQGNYGSNRSGSSGSGQRKGQHRN
jgi:hypothetical protein